MMAHTRKDGSLRREALKLLEQIWTIRRKAEVIIINAIQTMSQALRNLLPILFSKPTHPPTCNNFNNSSQNQPAPQKLSPSFRFGLDPPPPAPLPPNSMLMGIGRARIFLSGAAGMPNIKFGGEGRREGAGGKLGLRGCWGVYKTMIGQRPPNKNL